MITLAIPLLHISDSTCAERFYCDQLGFEKISVNRADPNTPDPCYLALRRDGIVLHLSSFSGDGVPGHVCNLVVKNVDDLYQEFESKGVEVDLPPTDQTWGNREMYVKDGDRNCLRFIQQL
jgi:uncharacterized glyoxalase superfamily protein PhnB